MNLFAASTKARHRAVAKAAGVRVSYVRGAQVLENLTAIPARVRDDDFGGEALLQLTARERDWLVWKSELTIGGKPFTPERGDLIRWVDGDGQTHRYEVLPRLGERCYRFTDNSMLQLRVFTVESAKGNL